MKASVITIGDEILIGQIVDTNAVWISQRLNETGVEVVERRSVGDNAARIVEAIEGAWQHSALVILTGGLGPTKDDLTKQVLAGYFDCGWVRHEASYEHTRKMLEPRGIPFNALNQGQSMVPACCDVLMNYHGTAPGMWFEKSGKVLIALPGVPFEMQALMSGEALLRICKHFHLQAIVHRTLVLFGMAESALAAKIAPWEEALPPYLKLAYLPGLSMIRLRLSAYDVDCAATEREIEKQFSQLEKELPEYVVGYDDVTVASAVATALTESGKKLAVAESCTGGAVSASFTTMPGASHYFLGSVVAYSNEVKIKTLGVDRITIEQHGAVSRPVAEQMAEGVRRLTGADYAIATTGVAGPDGGSSEKPVGTLWIAVATPEKIHAKKFSLGSLRHPNIERGAAHAINLLRLALLGEQRAVACP